MRRLGNAVPPEVEKMRQEMEFFKKEKLVKLSGAVTAVSAESSVDTKRQHGQIVTNEGGKGTMDYGTEYLTNQRSFASGDELVRPVKRKVQTMGSSSSNPKAQMEPTLPSRLTGPGSQAARAEAREKKAEVAYKSMDGCCVRPEAASRWWRGR